MTEQIVSPIIHIGFPKCASTTLQKQLFSRHPEMKSLGIFPTKNVGIDSDYIAVECPYLVDENVRRFHYNLVMLNSLEYHRCGNAQLFAEHVQRYIEPETVTVLSNERLTSVFFSYSDIAVKADRLKSLFPKAKVLVVIRNQFGLIESQYRDRPFDPRSFAIGQPVSLDRWVEIAWKSDHIYFLESLKYWETVTYYTALFGHDNVQVLLLEYLRDDLSRFSEMISSFTGTNCGLTLATLSGQRENRGVSRQYNVYRALRRRFLSRVDVRRMIPKSIGRTLSGLESRLTHPLKHGQRAEYPLSNHWRDRLDEYYAESNRRLQEHFDVNLGCYGYPL
jgi:hypothetical protein